GLRVLPTASRSARARFAVLQGVLDDCVAIGANLGPIGASEAFDPVVYVVGELTSSGIPWESVGSLREPTFEEWLDRYLEEHGDLRPVARGDLVGLRVLPAQFLAALDDAGWEIRRKEADS